MTSVPASITGSGSCSAGSSKPSIDGRTVDIDLPTAAAPTAVIVALHGYKGTPEGLAFYSQLSSLATAGQAVVAYPSGTPLDLGFGWNSGSSRFATKSGDDVAVISDVVASLVGLPCADATNVYLAGESNGGGMALRAACDRRLRGRIAGVVLVNAAVDAGVLATCSEMNPPISVLAVAGLTDKVVPYDGSRQPFVADELWFATIAHRVAGCGLGSITTRQISAKLTAHEAGGCGACATLFVTTDGGHTWPGAAEGVNGAVPGSFALTELLSQVVVRQVNGCGQG